MFTAEWLRDAAERIVSTWVETFLGLLIVSWTADLDWSIFVTAAWAAIPAALAVAKTVAAGATGKPDTAAFDRFEG